MGMTKKIVTGCLLLLAVSFGMVGCGNEDTNTAITERTTGNNEATERIKDGSSTGTAQTNPAQEQQENDAAEGGVLEDLATGIGEAGDDIINGAEDAVDRLSDDGIDSETAAPDLQNVQ